MSFELTKEKLSIQDAGRAIAAEETPQDKMRERLESVGIPYRKVDVYGSQIVITSACLETATKWASLLGHFAHVKSVMHSMDEAKVNTNTVLRPTMVKVWRTYATL